MGIIVDIKEEEEVRKRNQCAVEQKGEKGGIPLGDRLAINGARDRLVASLDRGVSRGHGEVLVHLKL